MKKLFFSGLILFSFAVSGQEASEIKPAAKGVVYDAAISENGEAIRKHYAKDAGKSKDEIKKIKGSAKEVQFVASGVKVLD